MSLKSLARETAAALGIHVARQSDNPNFNWVGLKNAAFDYVIDVGANEGQFARTVRKLFPEAKLLCFEPVPSAYRKLRMWADTVTKVKAVQTALGDSERKVDMFEHVDHSPSSSLLETTESSLSLYPKTESQRSIEVNVQRLDDFLSKPENAISGEILLKLDVQGYELPVLKGAAATLKSVRASIVEVCLDPLYSGQSHFEDIVELMRGAGLAYSGNLNQVYAKDGHVIYLDAVFVRRRSH